MRATARSVFGIALLGAGLAGCNMVPTFQEMGLPERGFVTHDMFPDGAGAGIGAGGAVAPAANNCTPEGCPQAAGFCTARGYQPGTAGYQRCLVSVEQNLRRRP